MQLWNWRGLDVINAHERDTAVYIDGIAPPFRPSSKAADAGLALYPCLSAWDKLDQALDMTRDRPMVS